MDNIHRYEIIYNKNSIYDQLNSLFLINLYYLLFHKMFPILKIKINKLNNNILFFSKKFLLQVLANSIRLLKRNHQMQHKILCNLFLIVDKFLV